MPEKVTIAMRTYERPVLLRRAIEGVLAQTFEDWRLVVLNNGGDRSTVDEIAAAAAVRTAGKIDVIHSERRLNVGSAVNRALPEPLGDYAVVHDDDDTWHPNFLQRTVSHMDSAAADVAGVATRIEAVIEQVDESGEVEVSERRPFTPNLERVSFGSVLITNPFPPIGFLFRTDAYKSVGRYGEELRTAEDWAFLLRLLERNRVEVIREVLANYHLRPEGEGSYGNIVSDADRMREADSRLIAHYLDDAMHRGALQPSDLALAISVADRDNHWRINELLDHVRVIRLLAGDIEFRSHQIRKLLVSHDETFAALRTLLAPMTKIAAATGGWRK